MKSDSDITVEISSPGVGSTGPMSMKDFRERTRKAGKLLKEVSMKDDQTKPAQTAESIAIGKATRKLVTGGNPDDPFTEFPLEQDFEDMAAEYLIANSVGDWQKPWTIGTALVNEKLTHLGGVRLGYLWKRGGGSRNGKAVLGKAVMATARERTFTDRLGFVVLSADHFKTFKLTRYQVEALIYHELLHFVWDEGTLSLKGHDFEAFRNEVEEYGLWKPDLRAAGDSFKQLTLV